MNTQTTTLTTTAMFSDDGTKRYLLTKVWDETKTALAVIMLAPATAPSIELDSTTQLVLNNVARLGYGSVSIVNLFATLNDFSLKQAEAVDDENLHVILEAAKKADSVVYAAGVGKAKSKIFQQRQEQVLTALRPMRANSIAFAMLIVMPGCSTRSPAVRIWHLSPLKVDELIPPAHDSAPAPQKPQKKKGHAKVAKESPQEK